MMIDKFPIKLTAIGCAVLFTLWAMSGGDEESPPEQNKITGSVIQPIAEANANVAGSGVLSGDISARQKQPQVELDERSNADLKARFAKANQALNSGDVAAGVEQLNQLTRDYPSVVEPYLNLAATYAQKNDLEMARKTLMRGIDSNQKAGMLFDGLKEVHGALAAGAYRKALDTKSEPVVVQASLPTLDAVVTRFDQNLELQSLKSRLENEAKSESMFSETQNKQIAELNEKLILVEKNNLLAKTNFEKEITALNSQVTGQAKSLLESQTAQREAEARVVRAEQDVETQLAQLKSELVTQKQSLDDVQGRLDASQATVAEQIKIIAKSEQDLKAQALARQDLDAASQALSLLQKENQELKLQQQAAALQTAAAEQSKAEQAEQSKAEQAELAKLEAEKLALAKLEREKAAAQQEEQANDALARQEQNAIARIKSWASAWAAQDVSAYVSHYADNYSSSRSITREQWLEQRQVRLTNKTFINVKVSGFEIKDLGEQFSVTFDQHYQSNTVDDIVRKRLIFDKHGDNWIDAKIVNERLVPKRQG